MLVTCKGNTQDSLRAAIEAAAGEVGVRFAEGMRPVGRGWRFRLAPVGKLGERKYQKLSASPFGPERRVNAVCWHGQRDFMAALFRRLPNVRIRTAITTWKDARDFLARFEDTAYINVGAPIAPRAMAEVCECGTYSLSSSYTYNLESFLLESQA